MNKKYFIEINYKNLYRDELIILYDLSSFEVAELFQIFAKNFEIKEITIKEKK